MGVDLYEECMYIQSSLPDLVSSTPSCNSSNVFVCLGNTHAQYDLCLRIYAKEMQEGRFGKPMLWIGIYIAVASLLCVLAMAADLFHGFRNKKLWFPSKYFTLNVASIMVITIAMKLPVDLTEPMPGWADQFAKLASLPFMLTMMANLMPSLASMDDKTLSENAIGLFILVITIVVNVLIQSQTGVIESFFVPYIYISAVLYVLIVLTSLAITAPVSKKILEIKYQAAHNMVSKDILVQRTRIPTTIELTRCVRRYYIMAGSSSPQFVMATTPLCSAASIICIFSTIVFFYYVASYFISQGHSYDLFFACASKYKWSMLVIFIVQAIGIVVGTIGLLFRCFAPLNFKLSLKWCKKHTKIFKIEWYWIHKLSEWKDIDLVFSLGSPTLKALVHNLNHFIVHVCIGCQRVIVVSCKTIALIPIGIVVIGVYCVILFKAVFCSNPIGSNRDKHTYKPNDVDEDIQNYVLKLDEEMELGARTLKSISNSVDVLIQEAKKQQPENLLKLVKRSKGFEGVLSFDSDKVQPLVSDEPPKSWSLPIVTLMCVAITLPDIHKDAIDSLFNSVSEGLVYTFLVDESLNNAGEAKTIQQATRILWHEVELDHKPIHKFLVNTHRPKHKWLGKWLGKTLQGDDDLTKKTPTGILMWFSDKAKEMVESNINNNEEMLDSKEKLIVANAMYRITQTMICDHNIEHTSKDQLFDVLSAMIASIMIACLINLPRVITTKCYGSTIEQREASVQAAIKILGKTEKIIETLQEWELPPGLEPDQMAFIDEWRVCLKRSIP